MIEDNNQNLVFKKENIQFFPEDIEKMKKMSKEECIEYKHELKRTHKYIVI